MAEPNKFDLKMIDIYREAKKLIISGIIKLKGNKGTIEELILPVAEYLQSNFSKRAGYRIPDEYIQGSDVIKKIKHKNFAKFDTIDEGQPYLKETLALLGSKHIKAIGTMVEVAKSTNQNAINSMVSKIRLSMIKNKGDEDAIIKHLVVLEQNSVKKGKVVKLLKDKGLTFLTDKIGTKRDIERYAEMITRTETANGYNQGTVNRAEEVGVEGLERIEKSDSCTICKPHYGEKWILKNGKRKTDRPYTYKSVPSKPPLVYHPNCGGSYATIN